MSETIKYRDAFPHDYKPHAWVNLTDAQIHKVNEDFEQDHGSLEHTRAIEAKLKELNQ
jgi:hypothetical protein